MVVGAFLPKLRGMRSRLGTADPWWAPPSTAFVWQVEKWVHAQMLYVCRLDASVYPIMWALLSWCNLRYDLLCI